MFCVVLFFFNDTATTEIYTLSLHDALPIWLEDAAERASREFFGKPALYMGEGGSIPFMAMLGERFPEAQFFITGVLGPGSHAHGPNQFLELAPPAGNSGPRKSPVTRLEKEGNTG